MWGGSDPLTTRVKSGENEEGKGEMEAWEEDKGAVDTWRVRAIREASCGRKWPIPRLARVHALC